MSVDLEQYIQGFYDEPDPELEEQKKSFTIEDDGKANWALQIIAKHQEEQTRLTLIADAEIDRIIAWRDEQVRIAENRESFLQSQLEGYLRKLHQSGYEKASYKLPNGVIKRVTGRTSINITDPDLLLKWAKENDPKLIEVKESVTKTNLQPFVKTDKLITEDGEIIPGAEVNPAEDKYKAVPNMKTTNEGETK